MRSSDDEKELEQLKDEFYDWWFDQFKQSTYMPSIFEWFLLKLRTEQKLNLSGIMQAEGSDVSEGAAVGSSAAGTATCGVDDNGWQCQRTTEKGGVASQCMNGCILERNSCEG